MEKIKVLFATSNKGKLRELIDIFSEQFSNQIPSNTSAPFESIGQAPKDCEETGITFLENAHIKCEALTREFLSQAHQNTTTWIISDDSGLCVDALNGEPGIHTARYAGDHVEPSAHMKKLLSELQKSGQVRPWKAHYHCALVLKIIRDHKVISTFFGEGQCFGEIVPEAQGSSGFGYDPVFLFSESGLRFSELPEREKNLKSHRMAAFVALKQQIGGRYK